MSLVDLTLTYEYQHYSLVGCSLLCTVAYIEHYAYMGDLVAMLAICTRAEDMMITMTVNQNVLCGWCCLLLAEFIGILVAMENTFENK